MSFDKPPKLHGRPPKSPPLSHASLSRKGAMGQALAQDTGRADRNLRKFSWEQEG